MRKIIFLAILSASCTKEVKYSKEALLNMAQAVDPSVQVVLPRTMAEGVTCAEYTVDGCLSAHIVKVKKLDMIAVEFNHEDEAIFAAKKYKGFYTGNWFLDDVAGEPVLEKFVTEHLKAKKP